MIFNNRMTLADGSRIFSSQYRVNGDRYVEFRGSKTGTHRVYFQDGPTDSESILRVIAHWNGYAEAASRAVGVQK
jgi:hypothetical protein